MELKQYLGLLWRWLWLIVLSAIVAGATTFAASKQIVPVYEATTTLLINQAPANSTTLDFNSLRANETLADTYVILLRLPVVLEEVVANLKLNTDSDRLAKNVKVTTVNGTSLMKLIVEDYDPQRAAVIANEIVKVFTQQHRKQQVSRYSASKRSLEQELTKLETNIAITEAKIDELSQLSSRGQAAELNRLLSILSQYRRSYTTLYTSLADVRLAEVEGTNILNVVQPAIAAKSPIRPKTLQNTFLAAIIGCLLTLGIVFLREYLDNTVKSSEEVEGLIGVSTLATIARITGSNPPDRLVTVTDTRSRIAEAYRMLRTNIEFFGVDKPFRTLVVTSSSPFEGKSTTAANLAVTIAQTGRRVILVDGDLRCPSLHKFFQQDNMRGVTTALLRPEDETVSSHLVPTDMDNLYLMPSGPLPPNPAELLGSQRMTELIEELKAQADLVIFDSPPILVVTDGMLLARACDATLMIVLAESTRADELKRAKEQLLQSGTRLLGTVLNCVSVSHLSNHNYYYIEERPRKRYLQWGRRLHLPLLHSRNGASSGSVEAVEVLDSNETTIDHQFFGERNGNGPGNGDYQDIR